MTASLDLWMCPSDGQASEGNPDGGHGLHETMFASVARRGLHAAGSAGGDDHAEIAIVGASRARSHSPCDAAILTLPETAVPSSRPVRGEPSVGGGVGVGAWGPQDGGHSVTAMAGAGAGAQSGVVGLASGQGPAGGGLCRGPDTGGRGAPQAGDFRPAVHGAQAHNHDDEPAVSDDFQHPGSHGDEADTPATGEREQAGRRRDPDYVRRRRAKHTAKQNARRKRG